MRLSSLLAALPSLQTNTVDGDPDIAAITADSRQVAPGSLFVAVRGDTSDGHDFISDALSRGAAAIVVEHPPSPTLPFVLTPRLARGPGLAGSGLERLPGPPPHHARRDRHRRQNDHRQPDPFDPARGRAASRPDFDRQRRHRRRNPGYRFPRHHPRRVGGAGLPGAHAWPPA